MDNTEHLLSPRLLKLEEVAAMLGISLRTVNRLIAEKILPQPVTVGRRSSRMPTEDVERYLEQLKSCR
ncbi:MAG: helix-turn-helix domain-containing protein [Verrucomicrobiales bacterium]|nr:helix-turn-helix domain-containing protein [Verrucomicrobiales bacterium]